MVEFTEYEYTISKHFSCALEYGDLSGLESCDEKSLEKFMADLPEGRGHWDWGDMDDNDFQQCEITGLFSDCVEVKYMVLIEEPDYSKEKIAQVADLAIEEFFQVVKKEFDSIITGDLHFSKVINFKLQAIEIIEAWISTNKE